jgi:hypothetical protein
MMIASKLGNYKVSRDYARLAELAKTESIICIVGFRFCDGKCMRCDGECVLDDKHTSYKTFPDGSEFWKISCRDTIYVYADSVEEFISRCKKKDVEFIEPLRTIQEKP